jgi:hypothetical protein
MTRIASFQLMEKIRQDFFSWLPKTSAKREIKPAASVPAAPAPAAFYPEPAAPLPAKHVRQAAYPTAPVPTFLSGDGNVLFKIIPVETDGAPLYQIVPTSSSDISRPVPSTFHTAASTQTYSHVPATPTSTVHEQFQAAGAYTPSQPAPSLTYVSEVSRPLPPPLMAEKASEEKSDIFNKESILRNSVSAKKISV